MTVVLVGDDANGDGGRRYGAYERASRLTTASTIRRRARRDRDANISCKRGTSRNLRLVLLLLFIPPVLRTDNKASPYTRACPRLTYTLHSVRGPAAPHRAQDPPEATQCARASRVTHLVVPARHLSFGARPAFLCSPPCERLLSCFQGER